MAFDSARAIVKQFLDQYGLGNLVDWAFKTYTGAGGGTTGMDAITANLPDTAEFKARFPAYAQLQKEGRAMSITDMLNYENNARQIMHDAGLPAGFYDKPQDFTPFLLGDVSASELQQRVTLAQQAVLESPADVRAQLHTLGFTHGDLTAHFLDSTVAEPILTQQFTAAQLGAQSLRTGVGQLNRNEAMGLARFGVTASQGETGFQQLGMEQGLFQQQVKGEQAIGVQTQLGAQFEDNTAAQLAFQQRAAQRKAAFAQDSGFQMTQQGVGGLAPAQRGA